MKHKGKRVKVYQKPFTKEDYEGEAVITGPGVGYVDPGYVSVMVRFDGESESYQRMIAEDDIREG